MRKYYPNYSIGTDAYADIPMVCEKYGTKAVIIGGKRALAAAADLIKEAVKDSKITITGVFEYGGEASREHIDELKLENNKNKKYEAIKDSLAEAYTIIATAVYVKLGIMLKDNNGWKYFWFLFLLIPVIPSICIMIYKRKITAFCYPMAIAAAYCGFSMYYNLWHPLWILFLTIPVFYIVFCPIDKLITKNKDDENK